MSSTAIGLQHVVPAIGTLIASIMFASPTKTMLEIRKTGKLGVLNPLPLVAMWATCTAWLIYAIMTNNWYLWAANQVGLLFATFHMLVAYGAADGAVRDRMLGALWGFTAYMSFWGFIVFLIVSNKDLQVLIWGSTSILIIAIYYGAPISEIWHVLRTRDSSRIYLPLAVMVALNAALWLAFGFAIGDYFIWVPNILGALFGVTQLLLTRIYPKRPPSALEADLNTAKDDDVETAKQQPAGASHDAVAPISLSANCTP